MHNDNISDPCWESVEKDKPVSLSPAYPSYWKEVFRKFRGNRLSVLGVICIILMTVAAILGPFLSSHSYEKMELDFTNIPPLLDIYQIDEGTYLYMHPDYYFLQVTEDGEILERLKPVKNDMTARTRTFESGTHTITIDYSFLAKARQEETEHQKIFEVLLDGEEIQPCKRVWNKTYLLGTDGLGRDILVRTLDGARISLTIAMFATLINSFIGIFYGGIAGYCGGRIDNFMMRVVDTISTIPMTLIVIMLMVVVGPGVKTIILAMGIANWATMARIVRGQILSLKEREFVLAAKAANAGGLRILIHHLIPNSSASIIVCITMMVPSAIFTESFLSFIGLGVSAPSASWGTLVNEGLAGFRSFPYQLLIPSIAICITILSLNFIGNGLRSAVDPYGER